MVNKTTFRLNNLPMPPVHMFKQEIYHSLVTHRNYHYICMMDYMKDSFFNQVPRFKTFMQSSGTFSLKSYFLP